jgi:hypothetical protein
MSTNTIPRFAFVISSNTLLRRPEMMTLLPFACSASARPRPMPEPPRVIKIVLPVSFITFSSLGIAYAC